MELQDHWILAQDTTSETSVIQEPFPLTWVECHAISWQGFTDWVHWESHGSPVPCLLFSRSVVSVSLQPHGLKHAGSPVLHYLPKFAQIRVHWIGDAIQPSHPLSPVSPALNLSQHQSLSQWVSSSHWVARVLEFELQHQSFQWIFRVDFL